jgi:hypothetical protein
MKGILEPLNAPSKGVFMEATLQAKRALGTVDPAKARKFFEDKKENGLEIETYREGPGRGDIKRLIGRARSPSEPPPAA